MPSVAVLTPLGRGAVASLAVFGPGAVALVDALFSPAANRALVDMEPCRILFGRWRAPPHEELVVCRSGPDEIEIHCHGGAAAVAAILASLVEAGCTQMDVWQWVRCRTVDALAAQAADALAHATTLRTAAMLLDQYHGALANEIAACAGLLEAADAACLAEAQARLEALAANAGVGLHLTRPFQVVLAGKPNVGKSSLMNALAGYRRSIVYDQPGTTRDIVSVRTAVEGWPVELSDTAGLRASDDRLEATGVRLALEHMAKADLVVLVFDASQPWQTSDDDLAAQWPDALVVFNKADLAMPSGTAGRGLLASALTGAGVDELLRSLATRLVPRPPPPGTPIPFLPAHEQAIIKALERLRSQDAAAAATALRALARGGDAQA